MRGRATEDKNGADLFDNDGTFRYYFAREEDIED